MTASVAAPRALTAASAPVNDPAQIFRASSSMTGRRDNWQDEAWQMYRAVGEFGYYVRWRSNSCSRASLIASEIDPDSGRPTGSIDPDNKEGLRVAEIVRNIAGGPLGQSQLVKRIAEVLTVPGELWVAILMRQEGTGSRQRVVEKWYALTRKQMEQGSRSNTVVIKLPDGSKHEFDPTNGDVMFRVWNPDAEDAAEPDSPVRACLGPLREIVRTTRKIANADDSRLMNNGILFVPSEASLPDPQAPTAADQPAPSGPPVAQPPRKMAASLQRMIIQVSQEGAKNENSVASNVPIVASAPGEHISKIQHLEFGKDVTDTEIRKRNDAIARLAMGLDMSPERLLGLGNSTNHWSARQIGEEDVQLHIAPVMETICQSIYDSVLRNVLDGENIDPDKYILWYDTGQLTSDPDLTDEAKDAFEKGTITAEALVRIYGLPDESMYDFASLEGWQQWAQDRVSQDPTLIRDLLPLLDKSIQALDFPEPTPALPPGQNEVDDEEPDAEHREEPDTEDDNRDGQHSARADTELAVVDLLVGRALELAGKRRRTRADMDRLQHVPTHQTHRYMGPVADSEVAHLIRGWDDVFNDDFAAQHGVDPERVRAAVKRIARRELTAQVVDGQVV
ncbi:hypothetical protein A5743_14330 [Mycolicibacterium conceptionense]|nr:hypothetical protein A5743_14330 [Mycolicibacterium conceptionense]